MLEAGDLVNAGTGRTFRLWHAEDPARPTLDLQLRPEADNPRTHLRPPRGVGPRRPCVRVSALRRTRGQTDAPTPPPRAADEEPRL